MKKDRTEKRELAGACTPADPETGAQRTKRTRAHTGRRLLSALLILTLLLAGCGPAGSEEPSSAPAVQSTVAEETAPETEEASLPEEEETEAETEAENAAPESDPDGTESAAASSSGSFLADTVPAYSGTPYAAVNGNVPFFSDEDLTTESFESYSELDRLGRCGTAFACVGQDLMPTEARGSIGSVKPTGWHTVKYDIVSGNYLYNRCHLIAYELAGENANELNLITGTRYFNVEGMLPFENMVADYVKETGNHVLYRVTPVFTGDNLVADGVLMEALSVEDHGEDIEFCVFCYNVQPGIVIDYATGDSYEDGTVTAETSAPAAGETESTQSSPSGETGDSDGTTYILNTNTHKFHLPGCSSVSAMSEKNKSEYTGDRQDVIDMGYEPCKVCNP